MLFSVKVMHHGIVLFSRKKIYRSIPLLITKLGFLLPMITSIAIISGILIVSLRASKASSKYRFYILSVHLDKTSCFLFDSILLNFRLLLLKKISFIKWVQKNVAKLIIMKTISKSYLFGLSSDAD